MNREILFKAKRKEWRTLPKEQWWVEGYYLNIAEINHFICTGKIKLNGAIKGIIAPEMYAIDINTLCQYTGLTDKNGKRIWENDILVEKHKGIVTMKYRVVFDLEEGAWMLETKSGARYGIGAVNQRHFEVCGNIFDNLEVE